MPLRLGLPVLLWVLAIILYVGSVALNLVFLIVIALGFVGIGLYWYIDVGLKERGYAKKCFWSFTKGESAKRLEEHFDEYHKKATALEELFKEQIQEAAGKFLFEPNNKETRDKLEEVIRNTIDLIGEKIGLKCARKEITVEVASESEYGHIRVRITPVTSKAELLIKQWEENRGQ